MPIGMLENVQSAALPRPQGLPLRILRPSIVGSTSLRHIKPGYIGNAGGEQLHVAC